jgi:hypothetical protein
MGLLPFEPGSPPRVALVVERPDRTIKVAQNLLMRGHRDRPQPVEPGTPVGQLRCHRHIAERHLFVAPQIRPSAQRRVPHEPTRIEHLGKSRRLSARDPQPVAVAGLDAVQTYVRPVTADRMSATAGTAWSPCTCIWSSSPSTGGRSSTPPTCATSKRSSDSLRRLRSAVGRVQRRNRPRPPPHQLPAQDRRVHPRQQPQRRLSKNHAPRPPQPEPPLLARPPMVPLLPRRLSRRPPLNMLRHYIENQQQPADATPRTPIPPRPTGRGLSARESR